jgi:hypothetical protein
LVRVEEAEPCVRWVTQFSKVTIDIFILRCLLEEDPIAQKHLAKIKKYRGEYDEWGNRLTRTYLNTRHLLEDPDKPKKKKSRGRRRQKSQEEEPDEDEEEFRMEDYNFGRKKKNPHHN